MPAMGIYIRGARYYARFKDDTGRWRDQRTPYLAGQEALAQRFYNALVREAKRRAESGVASAATVEWYGKKWAAEREELGHSTASDDAARLRDHVYPRIGHMLLEEVRPRDLRELVLELRKAGKLAPRTIRHIYATISTMFKHAIAEELIQATPCVLPAGVLPPKQDKDPAWRVTAVYSRTELETLISDERTLWDRRVLYALKGLAGLRHGESAVVRWSDYAAAERPLGKLTIARALNSDTGEESSTKTEVTRQIPVHPALAAILAEWRLSGWPAVYGRPAEDSDLIVPTRRFTARKAPEAQVALLADLEALGIRGRRGHDLRRTFVSLARADGARSDLLRVVTHGPSRDMLDVYTTFPWSALCEEIGKLQVARRGRAGVVALHPRG